MFAVKFGNLVIIEQVAELVPDIFDKQSDRQIIDDGLQERFQPQYFSLGNNMGSGEDLLDTP